MQKKIGSLLKKLKGKSPLVHHITNYVTVNDCANAVLALGGSPVMADEIDEVRDMVSIADALVINMGTPNKRTVDAMITAGKRANQLDIPIVFDPVGVGATPYRLDIARRIVDELKLSIVVGNVSEIKAMAGIGGKTKGVDASLQDVEGFRNLDAVAELAQSLSQSTKAIVGITGIHDIISDGKKVFKIENGHEILTSITGTGCMCTSMVGSFAGSTKNYLEAALSGIITVNS